MINHARTLLLNEINSGPAAPWERYMPEEFRPIELPSWLEQVRAVLVGSGGWADKTYSVEVLLTVISEDKYGFASSWLDRRITEPQELPIYVSYDTTVTPSIIPDAMFSGVVTNIPVIAAKPIVRRWNVRAIADAEVLVRDESVDVPGRKALVVNGLVALDDDIALSFNTPLAFGAMWDVEKLTRPAPQIARYPAVIGALPLDVSARLLRVMDPGDEVLLTYAKWAKSGVSKPEDLIAAYVMAYVFQATKLLA